jgi:CheY-like chemotaxis protein
VVDTQNRALLRLIIERVGFEVKTAENGRQAVDLCETWQPHLVWMDMRMPVMSGYEATKLIRRAAADRYESPPVIIALTASAFNEDRDAVLAAGCDDFVRRPFRESEIFNKFQEHLGVEFSYELHETASTQNSFSCGLSAEALKSAIARLPQGAIHELKTAIELSDMDRMTQAVAEIGVSNETLAKGLKELVDAFQFDRLLAILNITEDVSLENQGEKA